MIEKAKASDRKEIIAFIDRVFSEDFVTLHPKLYNEQNLSSVGDHYVIRENDKILACLCMERITLDSNGEKIKVGVIGSVSVCDSTRGKGYMSMLMEYVVELARKEGFDMLGLYGNTSRYRNFGFEPYGVSAIAQFTTLGKKAISQKFTYERAYESDDFFYDLYMKKPQKTLRKKGRFFDILRTWRSEVFYVLKDGEKFGYIVKNKDLIEEVELIDTSYICSAILGLISADMGYEIFPDSFSQLPQLVQGCESLVFKNCCNINVLNPERISRIYKEQEFFGMKYSSVFIPRIDNI